MDWYFWMDDDDMIVGAEHLRPLAATAHQHVDGFVLYYEYAHDENGNVVCELWRERLIRRQPGWKWVNPVHEVYLPDGKMCNYVKVPPQQIKHVHMRPLDRYSPDRNLAILEKYAAETTEAEGQPDIRTKIYLGTELLARERWAEAEGWLKNYLLDPRSQIGDERSQAAHKLALVLRAQGRTLEAIDVEFEARKERDDWGENAVGLCEAFTEVEDWPRAEHWGREVLRLGKPDSILILNPLEFEFVPHTGSRRRSPASRSGTRRRST